MPIPYAPTTIHPEHGQGSVCPACLAFIPEPNFDDDAMDKGGNPYGEHWIAAGHTDADATMSDEAFALASEWLV